MHRKKRRKRQPGVPKHPRARRRPAPEHPAPAIRHDVQVRHLDAHLVVVEKPAGLTTMRHPEEAAEFGARAQRYLPATLADRLPAILAQRQPGRRIVLHAVHRLDKETSGLVVFARTKEAERNLGQQFRAHSIERRYLAVVRGRAQSGRIESYLVRDRGDGRRGSSGAAGQGKRAVTHVRVLEELGDYTLVECRLETGRTHQVRIHLGESGTPICGERLYDRPLRRLLTRPARPGAEEEGQRSSPAPPAAGAAGGVKGRVSDPCGASRVALHAASLGFHHPATGKWMVWESPLPRELKQLVARLRAARRTEKP